MVGFTEPAGIVPHLGREEAERRHQDYLGPEHLLLGLLIHGDNLPRGCCAPTAWTWTPSGPDRPAGRRGRASRPQPSDAELLATPGIDVDAVMAGVKEGFGWEAYYSAASTPGCAPSRPSPTPRGGGTPLICWRVFVFVAQEATARGEDVTSAHWLVALLRDAVDPVEAGLRRWTAASGPWSASPTAAPARSGCWSSPAG